MLRIKIERKPDVLKFSLRELGEETVTAYFLALALTALFLFVISLL